MDVRHEAKRLGLALKQVSRVDVKWVWRRGTKDEGPTFLTERGALDWMARRIRRGDFDDA
jgi:hypothetical protein